MIDKQRNHYKVVIIQKYIPQYRLSFFTKLKDNLQQDNIDLIVIYGQPNKSESKRNDSAEIPWGEKIINRHINIFGQELIWQPAFRYLDAVDLVIIEQANKLLINYLLIIMGKIKNFDVAYWGHGKDFQASSDHNLSGKLKKFLSNKVNWWFAYTKNTADILTTYGYPIEKITIVENSIDTAELVALRSSVTEEDILAVKKLYQMQGSKKGIFIGALYKAKRLDFLMKACEIIKTNIPDFEMIVVGGGEEAPFIQNYSANHPWLKYTGPQYGKNKVILFSISDLFLSPDVVNLSLLDSFALGVPIITTASTKHSPEIDYLINGYNGFIMEDIYDENKYAEKVIDLLNHNEDLREMTANCLATAAKYTVENMVVNYGVGIRKVLGISG